VRVWRIAPAAHAAFDGEGARRHGSRWTPRGLPAVFTSATLSLAALERFVHVDPDLEPTDLLAIPLEIPDRVAIEVVSVEHLPEGWRTFPPPPALAAIGERWFRASSTPVLSLPSVVIPQERNFAVNPAHPDFARILVGRAEPFTFDPRMWKKDVS
jgi:RES domain-containing protein